MKTYINGKGVEIFNLDDNGNLKITGQLTAEELKNLSGDYIAIIRDPEQMRTPFTKEENIVYYLGDTSGDYIHGTWWEKYPLQYNCTIDSTSIEEHEFITYEETFNVAGEEKYAYTKQMLDKYPTTTKLVLTPAPAKDGETTGHWEVRYYDASNALLYEDILTSNLLYFTGYYFPFTPLNSDDYDEGVTDIIINVATVYALKRVSQAKDSDKFMPIAGGTFTGIINTENIAPTEADIYIIGTEDGRYKAGYFKELYTDSLKANTFDVESLSLEKLNLSGVKKAVTPGDSLIISDYADGGKIKKVGGLAFNNNTVRYLRQDGTFATPEMVIESTSLMDTVAEVTGKFVSFIGSEKDIFTPGVIYVGTPSTTQYQLRTTGVTVSKASTTGIFDKSNLNTPTSSALIREINNLGIGTVADIIEEEGKITLVYSNSVRGWYIDGKLEAGVVSKDSTLGAYTNAQLILGLTKNELISIEDTSTTEIKVTISKFIWKGLDPIQFDGVSVDKFLTKAGTWQSVTASEEGLKVITGGIEALDKVNTQGIYELRDSAGITIALVEVRIGYDGEHKVLTQVVHNIVDFANKLTDSEFSTNAKPLMQVRSQYDDFETVTGKWTTVYNTSTINTYTYPAKTWRTLTGKEWLFLISGRKDASDLVALGKIENVFGLIILCDGGTSFLGEEAKALYRPYDTSNPTDSLVEMSKRAWEKYFAPYAIFLPITGFRKEKKVTGADTLVTYWASTCSDLTTADFLYGEIKSKIPDIQAGSRAIGAAVRLAYNVPTKTTIAFSVSDSTKVIIAKSNLQYNPYIKLFRFGKYPWSALTTHNEYTYDYTDYTGWLDLFGYGTSGYGTSGAGNPMNIVETSTNEKDYYTEGDLQGNEYDWGIYNSICKILTDPAENYLGKEY